MGFFKSVFGGDDESPPRQIQSPRDLIVGDMMKMEFAEQDLISGQTLKVAEQFFYDVSAVENCKVVSTMEGADQRVFVSSSQVNPDRPLEVAVPVLPETVFKFFKRKKFAAIFDEPENTDHRLECKLPSGEHGDLTGFVSASYFQERTNEAYRSRKDCRSETLGDADWDAFDYKLMVADDRQHAIRIEVFDGGRTDVYFIAYLALSKVEDFWPAS